MTATPPVQQMTISESSIAALVSVLSAAIPVAIAGLTYLNDPSNYTGLLVCALLLVSILFWRNTNQQLQEVKAACAALRKQIENQRLQYESQIDSVYSMHSAYKAVSMTTIMNMFAQITRTARERDCGSVVMDEKTGAPVYIPPVALPPADGERRRSSFSSGHSGTDEDKE